MWGSCRNGMRNVPWLRACFNGQFTFPGSRQRILKGHYLLACSLGCQWHTLPAECLWMVTNLLCQMTKWPWSTCSCHNRDYFVIFPQQTEFAQTKGGFFLSHSNSQIESGLSHALFSPSAECLEPSPSTQTLLCVHRVWLNPTIHWWDNSKTIKVCDLWISSWNLVSLCLWLSKDQSNNVLFWVLFCFHEQNTQRLNGQKDSGWGTWEKVLLPIQTWAGMLRQEMQCWD